ncbi:hypothetical protein GALMADRAFT_143909 [Galerina marginata CBS 339.88]|uniref:DNA polymerase epsilon subunit D n=1 Tax=Galerina marginata (strain CBS 339.88) TaxID=685588 RepID=A0A067SNP1_GALM3|nr:hypothetical protein GALMADRAFT_143909 [Galerina marginata CBS 339.88]
MPRKDTYSGPISAETQQNLVSEGIENFELPKSVVMKIAKSSIPDNVKLQKETVLSLVKGSTVFINYLAATAHDVAQSKQHKSISASDVLKALEMIEFSDVVNKLQGELQIYRDLSKNDKSKKGTSNGASSSSRKAPTGSASASASAPPKGKGKEKASTGNPPPPPFTSAPLDIPAVHPRVAELGGGAGAPMDVDDEETSVSVGVGAVHIAEDEVDEMDDPDVDWERDGPSDQELVEEELEDTVALEDEEMRRDALGVEDRAKMVDDDD